MDKIRKSKEEDNELEFLITYLIICFIMLYDTTSTAVFVKFSTKIPIGSLKPSNPVLENLYNHTQKKDILPPRLFNLSS